MQNEPIRILYPFRSPFTEKRTPIRCPFFVLYYTLQPPLAQLDRVPDSDSDGRGFNSPRAGQQKTHFCLVTKVRFLNDVCFRQMMTASPNDVRCANDVCLTAHWANIASLRHKVTQHHICEAKNIISPQAMHHLKIYKANALIYLQ